MKGLHLTENQLNHNSGQDIWDYMFENQRLQNWHDEEPVEENDFWFNDAVDWLTEELLDGEVFECFKDDERYAYTSLGRHANLKRKTFKALQLQGNSICGNMKGGAISFTRLVKERWNIDIDYRTLPYECQMEIKTSNASVAIRKWIKDNE